MYRDIEQWQPSDIFAAYVGLPALHKDARARAVYEALRAIERHHVSAHAECEARSRREMTSAMMGLHLMSEPSSEEGAEQ